jgi:hypothetical protein
LSREPIGMALAPRIELVVILLRPRSLWFCFFGFFFVSDSVPSASQKEPAAHTAVVVHTCVCVFSPDRVWLWRCQATANRKTD